MKEVLQNLSRKEVKKNLTRIEPQESYSDLIADTLEEKVFGQRDACKAVGRQLAMSEAGIGSRKKPLGSMLFLGPSGVGKTEMSRAVANHMFQDPDSDRVKIINMAEMTERHYITKFVGSPPSYVGYDEKPLIPHDWLHKGRSIIVLDEFEKAHYDVRQLFLGVLDKGLMDARAGREGNKPLDFRDSIIIFTANIAGRKIQEITEGRSFGFCDGEKDKTKDVEAAAHHGLKRHLSPEFVNRLDSIVVFQEIKDRDVHTKIYNKFLDERNREISENLGAYAPFFATTDEFREYILDMAGNKGGREMRRILDRELFDKAADCIMGQDLMGKPIVADREDDCTYFYTDDSKPHEAPIPEPPKAEEPKKGGSSSDLATLWKPYLTPPKGDTPTGKAPSGFIPKEGEKETPKEKPKRKPKKPEGPDKPNNPPEDKGDPDHYEIEVTHPKLKENVVFMVGEENNETIDIIICTKKNKVARMGQIIRNVPLVPLMPENI
jgi:hypothetical protein